MGLRSLRISLSLIPNRKPHVRLGGLVVTLRCQEMRPQSTLTSL